MDGTELLKKCTPECNRNLKPGNNRIGHCPLCHKDFAGLGAYDKHIVRDDDGRMSCAPLHTLEGWTDDAGIWHKGRKMTEEEIKQVWG